MAVLGDLEQHVMAVLWRVGEPMSVRDVHEQMYYPKPVAYTTVMTVLDRLAKKDVVGRQLDGRAWMYRSLKSCTDLHVDEILGVLSGCGEGHARLILAAVQEKLPEVFVSGQNSCLTTGDPDWTPPARLCAFASACASVDLDCSSCPSRLALRSEKSDAAAS